MRIVTQMANPSVGRALERVSGKGSVLDVATLAGPSFVEACLRRPAHDIELAGVHFAVVQVEVADDEGATHPTFRGHFGNLAPVAIMPGDGSEMAQCPGRDHQVVPGDRVAVLGTEDELKLGGIDPKRTRRSPLRTVSITRRLARQAAGVMEEGNKGVDLHRRRPAGAHRHLDDHPSLHVHRSQHPQPYGVLDRGLLHGRDGGHRRLRRLHLRHAGRRHEGLRHRAHRHRGGPGIDRVRPVHQHSGQSTHRALPRSSPGPGHGRSHHRHRSGRGRHRRRAGPDRRGSAGRRHRARRQQPLPRPGAGPGRPGGDRRRHAARRPTAWSTSTTRRRSPCSPAPT